MDLCCSRIGKKEDGNLSILKEKFIILSGTLKNEDLEVGFFHRVDWSLILSFSSQVHSLFKDISYLWHYNISFRVLCLYVTPKSLPELVFLEILSSINGIKFFHEWSENNISEFSL